MTKTLFLGNKILVLRCTLCNAACNFRCQFQRPLERQESTCNHDHVMDGRDRPIGPLVGLLDLWQAYWTTGRPILDHCQWQHPLKGQAN